MSVPVDPLFTEEKPKTLKKTKDMIKKNFNIQVSRKAKHFPRVYYEQGRDAKGLYENMTMKKDVKKLVEDYNNYTAIYVKVQKNLSAPGTTLSKRDLEEPRNIYK